MAGCFEDRIAGMLARRGVDADGGVAVCEPQDDGINAHTRFVRLTWLELVDCANDRPFFIFGAGAHTEWLLSIVADLSQPDVRGILDDNPRACTMGGFDVVLAENADIPDGAMILVSSDRFERQLFDRASALFGGRATVARLYDGLPPGPYDKPEPRAAVERRHEATMLARRRWGGADFVGPYERAGYVTGFLHEQWLWSQRSHIRGRVLDMSTPRHWHEWLHDLPAVTSVIISDLDKPFVTKLGHASPVDILGDFCADRPPAPDESFDAVISASVIEHCADPHALVANLFRVLKPGGSLLLNAPFVCPDGHDTPDYWRFCRDGLASLARDAGFADITTHCLGDVGFMLDDLLARTPIRANPGRRRC